MNTIELLSDIETYCARAGLTEVQFGKRALASTYWVQRLRDNRVTLMTCARARDFMDVNPLPSPRVVW